MGKTPEFVQEAAGWRAEGMSNPGAALRPPCRCLSSAYRALLVVAPGAGSILRMPPGFASTAT